MNISAQAPSETANLAWFAVQVRARWEQSTATTLSGKGYETLLPIYESKRQRGQRVQTIGMPLFPGYVFCQFDVLKRLPILVTPGVLGIVSRGKTPIPVESSEIAAVQTLVASGAKAEPWPYIAVGERVRVEDTILRGLQGILVAFKGGHRVIVSVSLLQRSVALEIDRTKICAMGPRPVLETKSPSCEELAHPVLA